MSMRRTASSGSSPLARGLLSVTPATVRVTVDHPRSRGVYYPSCVFATHPCRIIPARAGFTSSRRSPTPPGWDHPRSRGVYRLVRAPLKASRGSSPLARGLLDGRRRRRGHHGIIPARAGFTTKNAATWLNAGDHPRSRGVYIPAHGESTCHCGSSPLARGLLNPDPTSGLSSRIIPARAGFTPVRTAGSIVAGDHPRSRGVYSRRPAPVTLRAGSSPLARGLPSSSFTTVSTGGIIPARAGFTARPDRVRRLGRDHPRSRGVYRMGGGALGPAPGSSPLARGLR